MNKKIMVVDDNPDLIYSVKRSLCDIASGYTIMGANGGKQCIDLLKEGKIPDLILLDIMMPDMDGWDVAAEIKSNPAWRKIPVVFLTAKTDVMSKGMGRLAEGYIEKPFDIYDLKKKVDAVLK